MKEKTFKYKGHTFEPIGNILGGWKAKVNCLYFNQIDKPIFETHHEDFYKIAKLNNASCDVYKIDNNEELVMMCCGKFRPVKISGKATLKYCEEYDKWYR